MTVYGREVNTTFDELNSAQFISELRTGAPQPFEILTNHLLAPLIRFLTNIMEVPEADSEELASDVLLKVFSRIQDFQYPGPAKLTTWIFEIAKNRAIDYKRSKEPQCEALHEALAAPIPDDRDRFAHRNRSLLARLSTPLNSLSEQDRDIVLWHAVGYTFAQIGGWLGMAEGTARVRNKRALDKLRQHLGAAAPKGVTHE